MGVNLWNLLGAIGHRSPASVGAPTYAVRAIPGSARHYFGRDETGSPCLLLGSPDYLSSHQTPIRLAGIDVQFAIVCKVTLPDGEEQSRVLTVIVCKASGDDIQAYFCHVCESILSIVGPEPAMSKIAAVVRRLVDLFQKLTQPASRTAAGLFAELLVASLARNPLIAVEAWRSASEERFDFSFERIRMEVKATSERVRAHTFSYEQCTPPPGTLGILASLFVEPNGGGLSLHELMEKLQELIAVDADLVFKLHDTVAHTLGNSASASLSARFDEHLATSSLKFFRLEQLPAIRPPLPADVSMVRFRSDLSGIAPLSIRELIEADPTASDLLPNR